MRTTRTIDEWSCDRCGKAVEGLQKDWMVAESTLSQAPHAPVTYHFCPECRDSLGAWFGLGQPRPDGTTGEGTILDRIINILYPLDGYRDDQWNGGDV